MATCDGREGKMRVWETLTPDIVAWLCSGSKVERRRESR